MGRKAKVGKQRKDRFYQLAKETGYRSRAAFKLIQLNRKFGFLDRSRVLIDLCSAPGGWLQVAQKFMPVSSVIIGIDLVPIKPVPNCMTFQCDITTPQCRSLISKELKTWKADVILNDGAPNVGKSWTHDAFAQIRLTLSAIQLSTEFLMKGGWFITKVFRSRDYNALMWLLGKLFKKVHATKPQASRHESAEIFVVCEKYLAPDKIDPKFFDPSYLFEDVPIPNEERKKKAELLKPNAKAKKAKPEGYADGDYTLYHKLNASDFCIKTNHIELLADSNEIVLDNEAISNHSLTTDDIKEYCKDLKVLGRKEILQLIAWRRKLRAELYPKEKEAEEKELSIAEVPTEEHEEEEEEEDLELSELKRKKKKILKERRKLNERMSLGIVQNDNELREEDDMELFTLRRIKNRSELDRFQDVFIDELDDQMPNKLVPDDDEIIESRPKKVYFDRHAKDDYDFEDRCRNPNEVDSEEEDEKDKLDSDDDNIDQSEDVTMEGEDEEQEGEEGGGLLVDLDDRPASEKDKIFFERGIFNDDDWEDEEDVAAMAIDARKQRMKEKKAKKEEKREKKATKEKANPKEGKGTKRVRFEDEMDFEAKDGGESDDDDDSEDDLLDKAEKSKTLDERAKANVKLAPEELALGSVMIQSAKMRREIIDQSWNRYMHADHDFVPSWFKKDEDTFFHKPLPVPDSTVREFKKKLKQINARPIKKIAEANARKRKRAQRKLERARKKAEALTDIPDMSEREKMATIRSLYKKALKGEKKKELTYVVAKKGKINKRPAGLKGRYKLVDGRLKKDKLAKKRESKGKGKSKSRSGPKPKPKARLSKKR